MIIDNDAVTADEGETNEASDLSMPLWLDKIISRIGKLK